MASTATTRGKYRKQGLGDGLNTWGLSSGLNGLFDVMDEAIHGVNEITLTGTSYTLSSTNYTSNDIRYRVLKFTGNFAATITIPATQNWFLIENNTGQTLTFSNGSNSATLANTFTGLLETNGTTVGMLTLPDGVNVQTVATDIASVNTVAGQISPTNNIGTLAGINADITTVATPAYKALVEVVGEATYKALVEVVGESGYKAFVETVGNSTYKALVETVGNATYKALVETVGETNYKAVVEVVGNATYKALVEVVGESVYKGKVETVADATYKSQIEDLNDATYKAQLQDIATSPYKPLIQTVGNATYKALVEVVGESTYKALVETVGNATYKALVEVVGESVYKGKVETVANNQPAISNVSSNISNVNNFNDLYQIASSPPSTDGGGNALSQGDLYFDTAANELKVWNGSAFQGGVTASSNFVLKSNNLSDLASASTARTNLGLDPLLAAKAPLASPAFTGSPTIGGTTIKTVATSGAYSDLSGKPTHLNVTGGSAGTIPYQTAANTTGMSAVGTAGQVLSSNGTGAPTWINQSSGGGGIATQMKFS